MLLIHREEKAQLLNSNFFQDFPETLSFCLSPPFNFSMSFFPPFISPTLCLCVCVWSPDTAAHTWCHPRWCSGLLIHSISCHVRPTVSDHSCTRSPSEKPNELLHKKSISEHWELLESRSSFIKTAVVLEETVPYFLLPVTQVCLCSIML